MAFVYCDGEGDCEGELGVGARCGTDEEFVYNAEDRDNAAVAAVVYEVRGTCIIIEFDEDNMRCLFIRIGAFQPHNIRDPV